MSRRRMTWDRKASAAPAMPGYQEPSIHPAAYPDPDADAYMNGDPSSWAEDPHPGPYPNTPPPPALPGQQEPQGHPATDPAHYFPKAASRQLRAAMQHKAAKCIRIAQSMLGRKASVAAIEDQALDLMNLSDRQIQAALARLAMHPMAGFPVAEEMPEMAEEMPEMAEEMPVANMTLTPGVTADDELLLDMMAEEEGPVSDDALLAEMLADEMPAPTMAMHMASRRRLAKKSEEVEAEEVEAEEGEAAKKAAHFRRLAAFWAKKAAEGSPAPYSLMPGDQNDPAHYNFRAEGVMASKAAKKSEEVEADDEQTADDEKILAEMEEQEAKKASLARKAKKSEEVEADEVEADDEVEAEEVETAKSASYMAEDPLADLMGEELEADAELASLYAMSRAAKKAKKSEEVEADDEVEAEADDEAPVASKKAKKSEEVEADDEEEVEEEEVEVEEPAAKKAALRPQPRKASNGVKSLGAVSKVASSEINDLAKLWETAPDVSKIFG